MHRTRRVEERLALFVRPAGKPMIPTPPWSTKLTRLRELDVDLSTLGMDGLRAVQDLPWPRPSLAAVPPR